MSEAPTLETAARWGREWQVGGDWSSHTVTRAEADRLAVGYVALLRKLGRLRTVPKMKGVGIGSGAGNLEAALAGYGIDMLASEWSEEGVQLIRSQNPGLPCATIDLMTFADKAEWDLILCRELYPFTRTSAFPEQMRIISRLIEALRPGGVLLVIGSDVNWPQCLDYGRMMREMRADRRVANVAGPVLELLAKRAPHSPFGFAAYRLQNLLAEAVFWTINLVRRPKLAALRVYAIRASG